ncbi:xanthine dehydrogenase family protein molybdopterin-binding subunit [Bradyrhizobium sp. AUGA SZCCT0240]|uniref:xanthine dehydrogenase family protein molybdopterin-binding subunit n=1 Tax=unclassified Bradyrhizobium TaxID=2631580 RepID=UPI001BAAAE50|nr:MULTISPECIES: xanthine dehydrogenase family protein molybdopterin-binding subunit [unclassified Bradyrhizobium]MBR1193890.1 xanthine dehydrogenase family protein molybdopterin-binding subunit [Bradyrhizobium sp. AUGA SZCCT0160]MBR1200811.1 xanthine dehydrogenase family protein molybdopterin-binding subunit [Bradyrhizobium sp. AUGA SZCCT0158]MBR1245146.1 xanthine dehydrogenase family protein molybdopterin-binding subunit [Bradyrhizobium sp. AUGA SZCCT0274]MBR1252030.1 xanthine dehydrogenase f
MTTNVIGKPLPRVDGRAKVTGVARYAADFNQPGQACAVIVGATVGLGRVTGIDTGPVEKMPGVIAVITHRNAPRLPYAPHKSYIDPATGERLHVLQDDHVRFYGQPVAVVVADTIEQAERGAAALHISYTPERPIIDPADAQALPVVPEAGKQPDARLPADTARGSADSALADAPMRVDEIYEIARENHNPMEPHATVAAWNGNRLTLWSKSQFVVNEQAEVAAVFGLPSENVQVICPFIGGAFGTTLRTWPHVTLAAMAARQVARPVKLVLTRKQMFFMTGHRPRTLQRMALGATVDGKLTCIVHEGTGETSRYEEFMEALTSVTTFLYSTPNVRTRYRLLPLDIGTPNHMRGPGEASGVFALECAVDELSYKLGMDPIDLRRRNEPAIDEGENRPFSSRSLMKCYDLAAERFGWSRRSPEPRSMRDGRLLVGMGVASASYPAFHAPASARARLLADGTAEVEVAASDMGPGTYTSMTQVAAETLGLPVERVCFSLGRSDYPPAPSHGGSWTMASVGSAVRAACLAVQKEAGKHPQSGRPIEAIASSQRDPDAAARFSMHAFGAVFAEVAVDPDVGTIRLRRAVGAYGIGRVVNPRLARSQCIGGMVGGMGMALMERTVLDSRDGRPVNAHMADYLLPVNLDIPQLEAHFVEELDPHVNALGVKGLGEIALVGMAPAIANAIFHATGKRVRASPIRIEDVLTV